MINRIKGGNESNAEPGFKAWPSSVGANVSRIRRQFGQALENGANRRSGDLPLHSEHDVNLQDKGLPVAYAHPKEGAVILMVAQCVIANNSAIDLSQKLAAYLLSTRARKNRRSNTARTTQPTLELRRPAGPDKSSRK